jgi:short-subunit dehydrogenase
MQSFINKTAVITGAASGIGAALANKLAASGANIALVDIDKEGLDKIAASLSEYGSKVSCHVVDVASKEQVAALADEVASIHQQIHLLFNNAGVSVNDLAENTSYEDFEWVMNINFWGVVNGVKAFLPYLRQVDDAHIINVASIFGIVAFPTQSSYNASKFAVRGYTEALYQELDDSPINVSCVCPGGVKTNIVKSSRYQPRTDTAPSNEQLIKKFDAMVSLTAEGAADQILAGVKKNKLRIIVGKDAAMMAWLSRLFPDTYFRWLAKAISTIT